ncbi:MAG: hypothetical protein U5S82_05935 [Gammaproteobacteria bacterium]|nr:hypothetical protein [Gammaproteobacteria bacterium]
MVSLRPTIVLYLGLALTWLVYSPGLSGAFLFDDYSNLDALGEIRTGSEGVLRYLTGVTRPAAYLSFLIDDNAWPSQPEPFLYTNVLLHLLTALVLVWLFLRVGRSLELDDRAATWVAVVAGLAWALHPLFVSTTLYVVQRMTILSALFILLGLLAYVVGRGHLQRRQGVRRGWLLLILALPALSVVAFLSKQNAALVPLYLLLFEHILFRRQAVPGPAFAWWRRLYVYLPVVLLAVAVAVFYPKWSGIYDIRHFALGERLLTEARVVAQYLYLLLVPHTSTNGLHYENFQVSTSLLEPWTTVPAVVLVLALAAATVLLRRRLPVLALAIGFYLAGHLMESTFIALELYFEHRNYLPSIFLFFALGYGLVALVRRHGRVALAAPLLVLAVYSGVTWARASLWGDPLLLMAVWTENNPTSGRNYGEGALQANKLGRPDVAKEFIIRGTEALPDEIHLLLARIGYGCQDGDLEEAQIERAIELLRITDQIKRIYLYRNFKQVVRVNRDFQCEPLTYERMQAMLRAALSNPNIEGYNIRQQEMLHLFALLELYAGNYAQARDYFVTALDLNPHPDVALTQIAILASEGQYELAMTHLREAKGEFYGRPTMGEGQSPYGLDQFEELEGRLQRALGRQERPAGEVQ